MNTQDFENIKNQLNGFKAQNFTVSSPEGGSNGSLRPEHLGGNLNVDTVTAEKSLPFVSNKVFRLESVKLNQKNDETAQRPVKTVKIRVTIVKEDGGTASFNVSEGAFNQLVEIGEKPFKLRGSVRGFVPNGETDLRKWVCVTAFESANVAPEASQTTIQNTANVEQGEAVEV